MNTCCLLNTEVQPTRFVHPQPVLALHLQRLNDDHIQSWPFYLNQANMTQVTLQVGLPQVISSGKMITLKAIFLYDYLNWYLYVCQAGQYYRVSVEGQRTTQRSQFSPVGSRDQTLVCFGSKHPYPLMYPMGPLKFFLRNRLECFCLMCAVCVQYLERPKGCWLPGTGVSYELPPECQEQNLGSL